MTQSKKIILLTTSLILTICLMDHIKEFNI